MPKRTRATVKRELERAVDNLAWVDHHLAAVFNETIEGHHDSLRDQLTTAGAMCETLKTFIERINKNL